MSLKAVLFDFNGIIIDDESIHAKIMEELLLEENLVLQKGEYEEVCLGRSDRSCLRDLLESRGRFVNNDFLSRLMQKKAQRYLSRIEALEELPIYGGVREFLNRLQELGIKLGIVSGATRQEIELVLNMTQLYEFFPIIIAGDDINSSKPEPEGYLLAVNQMNKEFPDLNLHPSECLGIEDTPVGVTAVKNAGMQVLGVANTYPFHMLHRCCNWVVDYFSDLELDRVISVYSQQDLETTPS
jgi:HAD superfamily hydrolase (TIGR01509 family)